MNKQATKEALKKEILQTLSDINAVLTGVERLMDDLQTATDAKSKLANAGKTATQSFEAIRVLSKEDDVMQHK